MPLFVLPEAVDKSKLPWSGNRETKILIRKENSCLEHWATKSNVCCRKNARVSWLLSFIYTGEIAKKLAEVESRKSRGFQTFLAFSQNSSQLGKLPSSSKLKTRLIGHLCFRLPEQFYTYISNHITSLGCDWVMIKSEGFETLRKFYDTNNKNGHYTAHRAVVRSVSSY